MCSVFVCCFFFFNDPATTEIYTLSLHDALPIFKAQVDYSLGQMYTTQGQTDQATTAYLDAVFNYPQSYYSYLCLIELVNAGYPIDELQRGKVDYYAGQYTVALSAFDRYLAASPSDPSPALHFKGLILRDQEDL